MMRKILSKPEKAALLSCWIATIGMKAWSNHVHNKLRLKETLC